MHDLLDQDEPDVFLESFVDVLSCGLGAALLLFLIFSTLPRDGGGAQGADGSSASAAVVPGAVGRNAGTAAQVVVVVSANASAHARIVFSPQVDDCRVSERSVASGRWSRQLECFRGDGQLPRCVEVRAEAQPATASELSVAIGRLANGAVSSGGFQLHVQGSGPVAAVRIDRARDWVQPGGRC